MGRHAPDPIATISVMSTKWSVTERSLFAQASRALVMTAMKLRKSLYSSTRASSRADQNSAPAGLTRLMRSKVLVATAVGNRSLIAFNFTRSHDPMKNEFFTTFTARASRHCHHGARDVPARSTFAHAATPG